MKTGVTIASTSKYKSDDDFVNKACRNSYMQGEFFISGMFYKYFISEQHSWEL